MDMNQLSTITGLIITLSVTSERLVEIIKGMVPFLNEEKQDPKQEGLRHAALQALAMVAGVFIAWLASPAIPTDVYNIANDWWSIWVIGLLASGGSGFWNSILGYVSKLKG